MIRSLYGCPLRAIVLRLKHGHPLSPILLHCTRLQTPDSIAPNEIVTMLWCRWKFQPVPGSWSTLVDTLVRRATCQYSDTLSPRCHTVPTFHSRRDPRCCNRVRIGFSDFFGRLWFTFAWWVNKWTPSRWHCPQESWAVSG